MIKKSRFNQLNKSFASKNKVATIKKENRNDWRKAIFTARKANSRFKTINLIRKPMMAAEPAKAKNNDK